MRLHCGWRLLGLAEAERATPDLGMRNVSIGCEHETPQNRGALLGPGQVLVQGTMQLPLGHVQQTGSV